MDQPSSKKKAIFQAAAAVFGQKGFDNASIDEIAKTAGVAKGTIFYYFENKEDLFSALIEEGINILSDEINRIIKLNTSIKEKLEEIIDFHFTFFKKHNSLCLMILNQLGSIEKKWSKAINLIHHDYTDVLESFIDDCKKQRLLDRELNAEALSILLFSMLAVSGINWTLFHSKVPQSEIVKMTRSIIFKGLKLTE